MPPPLGANQSHLLRRWFFTLLNHDKVSESVLVEIRDYVFDNLEEFNKEERKYENPSFANKDAFIEAIVKRCNMAHPQKKWIYLLSAANNDLVTKQDLNKIIELTKLAFYKEETLQFIEKQILTNEK